MSIKRLSAMAAAAATAALAGLLGPAAQPAAASQVTTHYQGVSAAFDNNPGNGAESWVWVHAGAGVSAGSVEYAFYDGSVQNLQVFGGNTSVTKHEHQDIWRIRACVQVGGLTQCGPWT
ncbi:hypothetical protein [Streptomyces marincola]|uniref:hypothetical protein n=1 Tax=Streptomyces marincola TaxID=2878388 RepID=UPI001CF1727F|nr:hypothetical protein [Streptomyces marincola]UCM86844.1 hypothetical protein LC193_02205 [Streptomyces marincola]